MAAVVACVPHGGTDYPASLAAGLAVTTDVLHSDLLTRELYDFLPGLGVPVVANRYSRFVADVNRDPSGSLFGPIRTSVVADRLASGLLLYRTPLVPAELSQRIELVHRPFHQALDAAVARALRRYRRVLLLDLHSFSAPLDGDILVGDRHGATARPAVTSAVGAAFTRAGFRVRTNHRYIGGWIVKRFAGHDRVDALIIELNQRCYLNFNGHRYPAAPAPSAAFPAVKDRLQTALTEIITAYP